ncbi:MAG: bacterial Ig-like domain-containing protein [Clostridia bacterium]|nr:bacterial Ig-like domain-containing protein [Clostridia bacterium]
MKNIFKFLIALSILVVGAFALTACPPPGPNVSSIEIADTPYQTTFVQGEDINLFGGTLSVVEDGTTKLVDLEDPNVTISGYNSNTVGQQIITVTYKEKTTTFYVKVVKRLAVSIEQRNSIYFVGEEFNRAYGSVVLTANDGISSNPVDLSSPLVSLSGLDTFADVAGNNVITISYGGYTDTFEVKVYEAADIDFTAPNKREYMSHDITMDLLGGVITYKDSVAVQDSGRGVTKNVQLTSDMIVSGTFNPSAATYEDNYVGNGGSNLAQTVKFRYGGHEYSCNISVEYSDVSLIKHYASILPTDINWADENLTIDADALAIATEASQLYFALESDSLRDLISMDELEVIMPIAAHNLYDLWVNEFLEYNDYISLSMNVQDYSMNVEFIANTYNEAIATSTALNSNEFKALASYNNDLWNILGVEELAQIYMYTADYQGQQYDVTIADHCVYAIGQEAIDFTVSDLDFAIELYDMLDDVTYADVENGVSTGVKAAIEACYTKFISYEGMYNANSIAADAIALWSNDEFYKVMLKYYYDLAVSDRDCPISKAVWSDSYGFWDGASYKNINDGMMALLYISNAYMPFELYSYYYYSSSAFSQLEVDIEYFSAYGVTLDATNFIYYNDYTKEIYDALLSGDFPLYQDLLESKALTFVYSFFANEAGNYVPIAAGDIMSTLANYEDGYYTTGIHNIEYFDEIINKYFTIIGSYNADLYFNEAGDGFSDLFYEEIPSFFEDYFLNAPYYIQSEFLTTFYPLAPLAEISIFELDADLYYFPFSSLLSAYYKDTLDEDTFNAFNKLMRAFEFYLLQNAYPSQYFGEGYGIEQFFGYLFDGIKIYDENGFLVQTLSSAEEDYEDLTPAQKAEISFLYEYLCDIADRYNGNTLQIKDFVDLSANPEWENRLEEFACQLGDYYNAYYFSYQTYGYGVMTAVGMEIDRAYKALMDDVLAIENEELKELVLLALDHKQFNLYGAHRSWDAYYATINYIYYSIRDFYAEGVALAPVLTNYSVNLIVTEQLENRLIETADVMMAVVHLQLGLFQNSECFDILADNAAFFKDFVDLDGTWTTEEKVVFADLHSSYDVAAAAFMLYYYNEFGLSASFTEAFMNLLYAYNYYDYYLNEGSIDSATLSEYLNYYNTALSSFNSAYRSLSADAKAAFEAEVGADNVRAYTTTPRRD